ncbi:MAG: iron-sulfur cluster-binding protein, partial [Candidatus Hodarchaeales archaeon]
HFTICSAGSTTEAMINCKIGDLIGLRGPFGNGFTLRQDKKNRMIVAGGMGIAPLRFLIEFMLKRGNKQRILLIHGAKTADELYYREELSSLPVEVLYCTDDGSYGHHGFPTALMEKVMKEKGFKPEEWFIYSCGPEIMLKNVLSRCEDHALETCTEISLADRHIRCGFGICGSCFIDDSGISLCRDGPVFNGELLLKTADFGKYSRKSDGTKDLFFK